MSERYEPEAIERRWQERWEREGAFRAREDVDRPKSYVLEMFPYPSGRIHMGHVRNYAIGDVIARFRRMRGFEVLHPMGWDAFGLPAENAAIERKVHPAKWTHENIASMRVQLRRMGFSYDWERELATCDPTYYRWEQLVFLRLLERGLAYRKHANANWCAQCATVLANEQVEDGACWRCGSEVETRALEQWFLRITAYADELLEGIESLGGWPDRVLTMQRNWIGRSEGARIRFPLAGPELPGGTKEIEVFTTRPDTLCGATFMSLAPEHPLVMELAEANGRAEEVQAFCDRVAAQSPEDRAAGKEGVFTGGSCTNPLTGRSMPIYAANFVLAGYGTGAVMAVPTHDQRDFEFATRYGLDKIVVIQPEGAPLDAATMTEAWEGPGTMVASGEFDGLTSEDGKGAVARALEARGIGASAVQFKIRDWCISRQRYWGAPIPVVHCEACGVVPVPEAELPVELPLDVELTAEGGSPLASSPAFRDVACPKCAAPARRETDTMDTFVESSWYFARFACADETTAPLDRARVDRWLPVDQYVGGIEHAVLHLIYARFFTRVLRDLDLLGVDEPFANLLTQGMVCKETLHCEGYGWCYPEEVEDGICTTVNRPVVVGRVEKMSKSKKNVVDPDALVGRYGADTVRLFCLFAAPPERDLEWNDAGVEGAARFLHRLWRLVTDHLEVLKGASPGVRVASLDGAAADLYRRTQRTIAKATDDVGERFHFNTAIAGCMELLNATGRFAEEGGLEKDGGPEALRAAVESVLLLLAPMVPHIACELGERLGIEGRLDATAWPDADPEGLVEEEVTVVVQVNGKVRGRVAVPAGSPEDAVFERVLAEEGVRRHLDGAEIRKRIFVQDRLFNLVVG